MNRFNYMVFSYHFLLRMKRNLINLPLVYNLTDWLICPHNAIWNLYPGSGLVPYSLENSRWNFNSRFEIYHWGFLRKAFSSLGRHTQNIFCFSWRATKGRVPLPRQLIVLFFRVFASICNFDDVFLWLRGFNPSPLLVVRPLE